MVAVATDHMSDSTWKESRIISIESNITDKIIEKVVNFW